jgi:hypothetical protein
MDRIRKIALTKRNIRPTVIFWKIKEKPPKAKNMNPKIKNTRSGIILYVLII